MGALALFPSDWLYGVQTFGLLALMSLVGALGPGDAKVGFGLGVLAGPFWLPMLGLAFGAAYLTRRRGEFAFGPFLVAAGWIAWRVMRCL